MGFAAETQHLLENAAAKVKKKNLDMIVANDVTMKGAGFSTDTNVVKLLFPSGEIRSLELMSKEEVGEPYFGYCTRLSRSLTIHNSQLKRGCCICSGPFLWYYKTKGRCGHETLVPPTDLFLVRQL